MLIYSKQVLYNLTSDQTFPKSILLVRASLKKIFTAADYNVRLKITTSGGSQLDHRPPGWEETQASHLESYQKRERCLTSPYLVQPSQLRCRTCKQRSHLGHLVQSISQFQPQLPSHCNCIRNLSKILPAEPSQPTEQREIITWLFQDTKLQNGLYCSKIIGTMKEGIDQRTLGCIINAQVLTSLQRSHCLVV